MPADSIESAFAIAVVAFPRRLSIEHNRLVTRALRACVNDLDAIFVAKVIVDVVVAFFSEYGIVYFSFCGFLFYVSAVFAWGEMRKYR